MTRARVVATSAATFAVALLNVARRARPTRVVLEPGDVAPEFELEGSDGRTYRLADARQHQIVVLAWFPKAFTGGCTTQCESIGATSRQLRATGAAFFGANVDTPATNREFAKALGLDFPILSDPLQATARAYGVVGASGFPSRWTFYIGADGRILSIDANIRVGTSGPDMAQRLTQLRGGAS